jgi:hypothetical protein
VDYNGSIPDDKGGFKIFPLRSVLYITALIIPQSYYSPFTLLFLFTLNFNNKDYRVE